MLLRKLYIKIRLFLYSIRKILNGIVTGGIILILLYLFVNSFVVERVIIGKANIDEINHNYKSAISFYDVALTYYKINHFSQDNKEIYFMLPYKISTCYLAINNKKASVESMLEGITSIQDQYGIFSKETGFFIRKYLIEYYLENNKCDLAKQEFDNLLTIYKTIGYDNSEMADAIRLSGDLYYQQKQYDRAMDFYENAYNTLSSQSNIDYAVFERVVTRICTYEVAKGKVDKAIDVYNSSINILKNSNNKKPELTAEMLLDLGDLYKKDDKSIKNAITSYEQAIEIIKKLPRSTYLRQNISKYLLALKDMYNDDGQFHKVDEIEVELARRERFSFL